MSWKSYSVADASPPTVQLMRAPTRTPVVFEQPIAAVFQSIAGLEYFTRYVAGAPVPSVTSVQARVIVLSVRDRIAKSSTIPADVTAAEAVGVTASVGESVEQAAKKVITANVSRVIVSGVRNARMHVPEAAA
jgi:hypothetical protein